MDSSSLNGKVALITGAGRGIGAGIALDLGSRGVSVIVNYSRSEGPAKKVVEAIKQSGGNAVAIKADIADPEQIKELFIKAKTAFGGKLDIVCSNAGIEHFDKLENVTPEDFDRIFAVNTRGQFFVAQQAYTHLAEGGRLVLTSSIAASTGSVRDHALYAGSKGAVEAFARCFAGDFGHRRIRVNVIAPGGVKSDMAIESGWRYIPGADPSWTMERIEEHVGKWTPLGRIADPQDIAKVVRFLVSEDGGWVNGQTITISGGAAK
ncbi:hypothetical protein G7Y89_g4161 [Cudoniella acicularis]|uniref:Ketoreductase domain-containing protein n=1 Tax=Cudoniella acicularis TaxID=354080 RepID=A0A8H4RQ05_9HELO|nr:hypothetical protein G7Y89_g4161 [Cudoniella acicularis]